MLPFELEIKHGYNLETLLPSVPPRLSVNHSRVNSGHKTWNCQYIHLLMGNLAQGPNPFFDDQLISCDQVFFFPSLNILQTSYSCTLILTSFNLKLKVNASV